MLLASSRAALRGLALARIPALATRRSSALAMDPMAVNLQPSVPTARSEPAQDVDDLKWIARYRVMLASTTAGDGATCTVGERCETDMSYVKQMLHAVVEKHGVVLVDRGAGRGGGVVSSGLLCSSGFVNSALLSRDLDWLEVNTGIHVVFDITKHNRISAADHVDDEAPRD